MNQMKCNKTISTVKGAALFAKRRRKSEKWVVDETNTETQSPSGLPDYHQQPMKQSTSPSILPAYSDAGKHRVQLNLHQEQVLEKYVKPGLKVVKTPWEAALETGSASSAFVEDAKLTPYHAPTPTVSPAPVPQYQYAGSIVADHARFPTSKSKFSSNPQRDLAYKPSLPQGWKSPSVTLPKDNERLIKRTPYNCEIIDNKRADQEIAAYNKYAETTSTREVLGQKQTIGIGKVSKPHEFLDYLIPSSELTVSPILIRHLWLYNDAIAELKETAVERHLHKVEHQQQKEQCNENKEIKHNSIDSKQEEPINVCDQLERLKSSQSQLLEEQKQKNKYLCQIERRTQMQQNHQQQQSGKQVLNLEKVQKQEGQQQSEEEEYTKVAVRDLISNYEQQLVEGERYANQQPPSKITKSFENLETIMNINEEAEKPENVKTSLSTLDENECTQQKNAAEEVKFQQFQNTAEELYLPKEISLESYAPPPLVNIKEPENYKPSWRLPTTSSPAPNCFPLGKPSTAGFLNYGSTSPKQQYYEPTLYKPAQQETTPNMPQISYNPLPLPYDKIAKFENATEPQTQNTDWNPQHRRLAVQSQGSKARNASPAPFGEKPTSIERLSSPSPYSHNATKNEVYERTTAPIYTRRHNINELLHGQNYNNIARGWLPRRSGTGIYPTACGVYNTELGAKGYGGIQQIPLAAAKDLPYTDF